MRLAALYHTAGVEEQGHKAVQQKQLGYDEAVMHNTHTRVKRL
jgi:hypothetical protein